MGQLSVHVGIIKDFLLFLVSVGTAEESFSKLKLVNTAPRLAVANDRLSYPADVLFENK